MSGVRVGDMELEKKVREKERELAGKLVDEVFVLLPEPPSESPPNRNPSTVPDHVLPARGAAVPVT